VVVDVPPQPEDNAAKASRLTKKSGFRLRRPGTEPHNTIPANDWTNVFITPPHPAPMPKNTLLSSNFRPHFNYLFKPRAGYGWAASAYEIPAGIVDFRHPGSCVQGRVIIRYEVKPYDLPADVISCSIESEHLEG